MNFIQNDANFVNSFSRFFIGYLKKSIKSHWLKSWQFDSWKLNLKACMILNFFRPYCTGLQMIPGPQMIPDRKWTPNWTANDSGPEIISILDRKWSRSKNKEWHGFISEEGENIYKNYELKNMFYHFTKKYSTVAVLFFERFRSV